MALTIQEVERIAELAKLALTDEEKALFAEQLGACLDYFDSLKELETEDIPPMTSAVAVHTVLREDVVKACLTPEKVLANAPDARQHMFRVNAVLE